MFFFVFSWPFLLIYLKISTALSILKSVRSDALHDDQDGNSGESDFDRSQDDLSAGEMSDSSASKKRRISFKVRRIFSIEEFLKIFVYWALLLRLQPKAYDCWQKFVDRSLRRLLRIQQVLNSDDFLIIFSGYTCLHYKKIFSWSTEAKKEKSLIDELVIPVRTLVNINAVRDGAKRFAFLLESCKPGSVPDAPLLAALLDLVGH